MTKLVTCLQAEIPEFLWGISVLKAKDYLLAQDRTRVFLRGIRSSLCPNNEIPAVLPAFGHKTLKDFLAQGQPPVNRESLTICMKKNLADAQIQLKEFLAKGQLEGDDLVCYPLDRANEKKYKRQVCKNKVPTLLTGNGYLFVSDVQVDKPDHERAIFRLLMPEERFTLQGFPACIASSFQSSALQIKASGNAYPVPLIGAALLPLVALIGDDDLPHMDKPLEDQESLRLRLDEAMYGKKKGSKKSPKKKPAKKESKKKTKRTRKQSKAQPSKTGHSEAKEKPEKAAEHNTAEQPAARSSKRPVSSSAPSTAAKTWRVTGFLDSLSSSS